MALSAGLKRNLTETTGICMRKRDIIYERLAGLVGRLSFSRVSQLHRLMCEIKVPDYRVRSCPAPDERPVSSPDVSKRS